MNSIINQLWLNENENPPLIAKLYQKIKFLEGFDALVFFFQYFFYVIDMPSVKNKRMEEKKIFFELILM